MARNLFIYVEEEMNWQGKKKKKKVVFDVT